MFTIIHLQFYWKSNKYLHICRSNLSVRTWKWGYAVNIFRSKNYKVALTPAITIIGFRRILNSYRLASSRRVSHNNETISMANKYQISSIEERCMQTCRTLKHTENHRISKPAKIYGEKKLLEICCTCGRQHCGFYNLYKDVQYICIVCMLYSFISEY